MQTKHMHTIFMGESHKHIGLNGCMNGNKNIADGISYINIHTTNVAYNSTHRHNR